MSVAVRAATHDDLPGILAILNDAIANTTASWQDEPRSLADQRSWLDAKAEHGWPVLVAGPEDEVAGWATFGPFRAWPGYRLTVEHSVYVTGKRRRAGIGTMLVSALIDEARSRGLHVIIGGLEASNIASLTLHERLGFERVAHLREVGTKFGRYLDLVFMQLILDPPS